ncbi:hypothetical protein FOPG_16524 [Fusarium oxysporum f. sp. conglutinans race 2 54008]|nr:hypothetical protein FOPG_16524 [Fusarium oxysporum f. sp. conglutinans race 2 54008]
MPKQCEQCFERHCWNGTTSDRKATAGDFNLTPRLEPELSFAKWNESDWEKEESTGSGSGGDGSAGVKVGNNMVGLVLSLIAMAYML